MQVICKGLGALGITCHSTQPPVEVVKQNFSQHVADWGLSYGTQEEYDYRFALYLENDKIINDLNAEPSSFVVGHNMFSTMTKAEYNKHKGRMPTIWGDAVEEKLDTSVMAGSVDWREKNVVNSVQNQGACGSCWAFSSIAAIESSHAIQKGELLKLSE
jgi:C1A family cysteine protease